MTNKFLIPGHDKATIGRKCIDNMGGEKHNRCTILPVNVPMVADALERRNQNWTVLTKSASDLIIQVGDSSFSLHKLPMVSRSEYLNRLVFQRRSNRERNSTSLSLELNNLPGGTNTFELVVKFCYGWKIELTAANIAPLYSAAHFLEMSENLEQGNLISKAEAFLSFSILSSWKDTFRIFKSCESISSWAKNLQIVKRCSEAAAWKACAYPKAFTFDSENSQYLNVQACKEEDSEFEERMDTWWFEDVSFLRIDHFVEVIQSIRRLGMRSEIIGSCIAHWTTKWLSRITFRLDSVIPIQITHQLQRVTTECLIKILPTEEHSVSVTFLLHLLQASLMLKLNPELLYVLERRIAVLLERCQVPDILVKNCEDNDTLYDVDIVTRVLEAYVSCILSNPAAKRYAVGRLVDGYLIIVARDENLTVTSFQSLVEALPQNVRYCDDNLYRAIDIYLKAHPNLAEEERTSVCKVLEYHRLSQEARQHVMRNDRLPSKMTTQFILLEQVNMTRSMTSTGSNYRRTKTQAIIRVSKSLEKGRKNSQEIKMMRKEVDTMKVQLNELHVCKLKLQKQLLRCIH